MYNESVDRAIIAVDDVTETVGATQPPTPAQMSILSPIPIRDTPPDLGARTPFSKDTPNLGILHSYATSY